MNTTSHRKAWKKKLIGKREKNLLPHKIIAFPDRKTQFTADMADSDNIMTIAANAGTALHSNNNAAISLVGYILPEGY